MSGVKKLFAGSEILYDDAIVPSAAGRRCTTVEILPADRHRAAGLDRRTGDLQALHTKVGSGGNGEPGIVVGLTGSCTIGFELLVAEIGRHRELKEPGTEAPRGPGQR